MATLDSSPIVLEREREREEREREREREREKDKREGERGNHTQKHTLFLSIEHIQTKIILCTEVI